MNYRFENRYTYADTLSWGVEIRNLLLSAQTRNAHLFVAIAIQFMLWAGAYWGLSNLDLTPFTTMLALFWVFILIGWFYEGFLMEWLVRIFDTPARETSKEAFESVIEVTDAGITSTETGRTIFYDWSVIHAVHDTERNVILISDTLHPVIPARCFADVYAKDAFVRACQIRIPGYDVQSPEVFS